MYEKIGRIPIRVLVFLQLSRLTCFALLGLDQMAEGIQTANNHIASVFVGLRLGLSIWSPGPTIDSLRPSS